MRTRRVKKLEEKEDRISDLPNHIIQHILCFLPSTKEAIRTSVLSKRWKTQWTKVGVLIFINPIGMSHENFLKFIDNTLDLHDCLKIEKFHLQYFDDYDKKDPQFASKISFATGKYVEDLHVSSTTKDGYMLPEFLFDNASLVKLRTECCCFVPNGKVNWECLTVLSIGCCKLTHKAIEQILSGSPLLKSLELTNSILEKIVISSKSLKILVIKYDLMRANISVLEISCPNLEELSLKGVVIDDPQLFAQAIENVVSNSLLLESFKLNFRLGIRQLVIASKSLKRLVLGAIHNDLDLEISCPQLEELNLEGGLKVKTAKFLNLPSSLCATIYLYHPRVLKTSTRMIEDILEQLKHVQTLIVGSWIIEVLSAKKVNDGFSSVLNTKCLTLNYPYLKKHHSGIWCLLSVSPLLEKLVIHIPCYYHRAHRNIGKGYWISNARVFNCLELHLKIIKIIGFPAKDGKYEHLLNFVQFLLNNSRVLEKMVVVLQDNQTTSRLQVFKIMSALPRCSQNAIIEVLCSK